MGWTSHAVGALILSLAIGASASAGPRKVITRPDWQKKPTGDEMADLFPKRAVDEHVSGSVRLTCQVKADGVLVDCKAHHEKPKGYGFADAALALAGSFLMKPKTIDGQAVDGGEVNIPLVFGMPEDRLGDGAFITTRIGTAATPTATGPTVPCPDGFGECDVHPLTWAEQPTAKLTPKITRDAPKVGVTFVVCTVGVDRSLQGCSFVGDTSARAKSAIQATLSILRAPDTTHDGLETALATVVLPFHWDQIAVWSKRRS